MGNTNERQRDESGELSITEGEVLNTDEESNLEKKVEELQMVVSRRNKQIKELKVKLGKRERDLDRLEKDFADEKCQSEKYERRCYQSERRVKELEASLNWWEGKDRKQRVAAEQMKRRKEEEMEIERRIRFEEEVRDKVKRDLEKKRKLDDC